MDLINYIILLFLVWFSCCSSGLLGLEKGSIVSKKCEYVFRASNQYFTSPGYPEFYPNRAVCRWKIVASEGFHIKLTIINVDIEDSKHCKFDSVTVYDGEGDTAIPIRRLCGTKLPENIQSISNVFTITMETDGYGNGKGFQMKYSTVPECLLVSEGSTGMMESPGYPLGYPDGVSCNFHFPLVEVGKFIHIYFEDFQLEEVQHYECFDHLSIITLNEAGEDEMEGQFCGTALKEKSLCFKTGQLSMKFVTDKMWSTRGFKVSYMISVKALTKRDFSARPHFLQLDWVGYVTGSLNLTSHNFNNTAESGLFNEGEKANFEDFITEQRDLYRQDECTAKDDISLLIDETVQSVQLTDLQVLQQLLERELDEAASYISSIVNDQPIEAEQSKLANQHEESMVNQPIELQRLSSKISDNKPESYQSNSSQRTDTTITINTKDLFQSKFQKLNSAEISSSRLERNMKTSNRVYTTQIPNKYRPSYDRFTAPPADHSSMNTLISLTARITPSKSVNENHPSSDHISDLKTISPSSSTGKMKTSVSFSQLESSLDSSSYENVEGRKASENTILFATDSLISQLSTISPGPLHINPTSTKIAENSTDIPASSDHLEPMFSMTSQQLIPTTVVKSDLSIEYVFATNTINPSKSSLIDLSTNNIGEKSTTQNFDASSTKITPSNEYELSERLMTESSEATINTQSTSHKNNHQQQISSTVATETLCSAPIFNLPTTVLVEPSHSASVLEAYESKALKIEKMKRKCDRYLNFDWRGGKLPLNKLSIKAKEVIRNAFNSNILSTFEVTWPQDDLVGGREIMNYGNLLTTAKGAKFLLRIVQQNHIHLVEITKEIEEAYGMEKLMELPTNADKEENLKEYLRRIPSTVKVSLLFC